jgi:hypothetical protein
LLGAETLGTQTSVVTFNLPPEATRVGWTRFEIVGPAPQRSHGSEDPRRLSVCVYDVVLR